MSTWVLTPPPSICVHLSLTPSPLRVDVINGWPLSALCQSAAILGLPQIPYVIQCKSPKISQHPQTSRHRDQLINRRYAKSCKSAIAKLLVRDSQTSSFVSVSG